MSRCILQLSDPALTPFLPDRMRSSDREGARDKSQRDLTARLDRMEPFDRRGGSSKSKSWSKSWSQESGKFFKDMLEREIGTLRYWKWRNASVAACSESGWDLL